MEKVDNLFDNLEGVGIDGMEEFDEIFSEDLSHEMQYESWVENAEHMLDLDVKTEEPGALHESHMDGNTSQTPHDPSDNFQQHNEQTQQAPDVEWQLFLQSAGVQMDAPPLTHDQAKIILDVWQPTLPVCPPPGSPELFEALGSGRRLFQASLYPISRFFKTGGPSVVESVKRTGGKLINALPPNLHINYIWKFEDLESKTLRCFWQFGFSGKSTQYSNRPTASASDSTVNRSPSASNISSSSNCGSPFSPASDMSVPQTPENGGGYIQNDNNKRIRAEQGCRAAAAAEGSVETGPSIVDARSVRLDFTILQSTAWEQLPPDNLQDTAVNLLTRTEVVEERVDDISEQVVNISERLQRLEVSASMGSPQQNTQQTQMNAPVALSPVPFNPAQLPPRIDQALAAIVAYLQSHPGSHRAVDIARNLGLQKRSDVNPALYALHTLRVVNSDDQQPPRWSAYPTN